MAIEYAWRGPFNNNEVNELHGAAFGYEPGTTDVRSRVDRHSLGWVCVRDGGRLVGFVNVVWDGAVHAFLLDTIVAPDAQRRGIGQELVWHATNVAREAGCAWLHVDFEPHLRTFYFGACGFHPTDAGLINLKN